MSDTEMRRDAELIADLNDLLQLDHDAVEAYTVAIDTVRAARYRETLVAHRADHKRHIEELATLVRARGGLPVELPHPTAPFKLAVQALGAAGGDLALLLAFKAIEGQVRDKYQRFAAQRYPEEVAAIVRRAAEDERRHSEWVESALSELGAGRGTLPHGLADVVERVHKAITDPAERIERELMRRIGEALATMRERGGRAARPPADAARFIEAQHDLETKGDVEAMVALFDEDAIIQNPRDPAPLFGREGARRFWRSYRESFEEIHSDFSRIVATEDTAMLEWTSSGRSVTGERVVYSGVSVVEMRDGLVHRFRAYFDTHELEVHPPEPRAV